MTDTEQKRIEATCKVAHIDDISDLSDGYHTFRQLYHQRMMLFAALVRQNRDRAWKSLRHEDGELCFGGGWFIVGIDTVEGSYTYHFEDNYFNLFDCVELERGKHWDGYTEKDVTRLLSLEPNTCADAISRDAVLDLIADYDLSMGQVVKCIHNLPPVKLVRNTITKEEAIQWIQWIPTSERQPEHTGDYLVTMGINYDGAGMFDCIRVASYNICFGWGLYEKNDTHTLFGEITAWAELPKIYS